MRTNFTTGSDEMVSGGILLDQMQNSPYLENHNRNGSWTPVQSNTGAVPPPANASPNGLHGSFTRDQSLPMSPNLPTTSGANPTYPPPTPVSVPLRRSSTVLRSVQGPPQALDPPSLIESPKSARNLVAVPFIDFRPPSGQVNTPVESSPKTYAMALAGDRDRTPTVDSGQRIPCLYANCHDKFTSQAKLQSVSPFHFVNYLPDHRIGSTCSSIRNYSHAVSWVVAGLILGSRQPKTSSDTLRPFIGQEA